MRLRLLFALLTFTFSVNALHSQAVNIVSKFDPKLIKYYKVDTCRVYENVDNGQQTVQYLKKLYLFNKEGYISQEVEFGQSEYDGHTIIKYDYDSYQNISRKQILKVDREPIVYEYLNIGKQWKGMTVTYPYLKEYEVQSNDQGLILGIIVKSMIPEKDSIGDPTGKEIFGVMEEYEFRYNRHYKVVKENYYYLGTDMHTIVYQYPPNGYGLPISMSFFKPSEKAPEYTTAFSYDPTGFLHMEVTKETVSGYTNTLEYEYAYAWDSPLLDTKPELNKEQKFWIGKKK